MKFIGQLVQKSASYAQVKQFGEHSSHVRVLEEGNLFNGHDGRH